MKPVPQFLTVGLPPSELLAAPTFPTPGATGVGTVSGEEIPVSARTLRVGAACPQDLRRQAWHQP
ncbi:hypothetical protein [Mastigocladopsis repens]|uniref:hypothetical protein n=1 Tax=Mastigocladopsis repens TaxID=221287 RepID=UPI0002E88DE6|nr:hypothetical protein [Mastigocladopsis repens]